MKGRKEEKREGKEYERKVDSWEEGRQDYHLSYPVSLIIFLISLLSISLSSHRHLLSLESSFIINNSIQ